MSAAEIESIILPLKRQALERGGVDNWVWYEDSLESYVPASDALEDDRAWLSALDRGGVDNWEWYGDCLSRVFGYAEYLEGLDCVSEATPFDTWVDEQEAAEQQAREDAAEREQAREDAAERERASADPARRELVSHIAKWEIDTDDVRPLDIDQIVSTVWKRGTFTPHFEAAMGLIRMGGTFADARMNYVRRIIDSGVLDRWLDANYGGV